MEGDKERKKETVKFTSVELIIILLLVAGFICPSLLEPMQVLPIPFQYALGVQVPSAPAEKFQTSLMDESRMLPTFWNLK